MIGQTVSHYRIDAKIGAGGMGVVYEAEDIRLGRKVAVKFLPASLSSDALSRNRFEREAKTSSALNHPNICMIFDIGEHEGQPYIVMELLRGETLKEKIAGKPLKLSTLLRIADEIAGALATAHESGIIHRDIKSTNIFIDVEGRSRLLDFGLAKLLAEPQSGLSPNEPESEHTVDYLDPMHTTTGTVLGTTSYMSPEQARGERVDERSDLFSFGVLLYEMATGRRPFGGKTLALTFDDILNKTAASVAGLNPDIPEPLERIIMKALAKEPRNRFQTAREMKEELRQIENQRATVRSGDDPTRTFSPSQAETIKRQPSIAVLPFVNRSGDPENDYFGEGLAEELISTLMQLEGVRVASRTAAFQFKDQHVDVAEIGKRLNANTVLEGSFRIGGNRLRILANFINVSDGYQLWNGRFDRTMEDIFAVQDEIARTIASELELSLTGQKKQSLVSRPTKNAEAYNLYLRGLFYWNKRTPETIRKAVDYFKQALAIDPEYAVAHAGLADCYAMLGIYAVMPRRIVMPQARESALKALSLDESLPEAHAALGLVSAIHDFQWGEAESHFEQAIARSPDYAMARFWYAWFVHLPQGRFDQALGEANWASQLDPVNPSINSAAGMIYYMQGEFERAIESMQPVLELDPNFPLSNLISAWCYISLEMFDEAFAALDRCGTIRVPALGARAWARIASGSPAEARKLLAELEETSIQGNSQADFEIARIHMLLGDLDAAFARLDRTHEERAGSLYWINVNPLYEPLRRDPRYDALLEKLHLTR